MNRDGSAKEVIGARTNERSLGINQYSGRVIDMLPDDPKNILMEVPFIPERSIGTMTASDKVGLGVQKIDAYTGRGVTVERPFATASYYLTDSRGNVRLRGSSDVDTLTGYIKETGRIWDSP